MQDTLASMEYVDTSSITQNLDCGEYFYGIVTALVNRGYERGVNIFGAPYDFRKGPSKCISLFLSIAHINCGLNSQTKISDENTEWFERLPTLVKMAYEYNNTSVTFVVHSMGGRMLLQFLQQQSTEWKDKYVNKIITLSVPWGGSVQSLQAISVGYDFGSKVVRSQNMKEVQASCPSVLWMSPSNYFWKPNETLVRTNKKNYTVTNIDEFFR